MHAGVQLFRPVADHFANGRCVIKREKEKKKQLLSLCIQKEKKIGIHFIISFQYFINILVITVKAGWVLFFFIYEGTLRRCIFFKYVVVLLKKRVTQAASDS